MDKIVFKKFCKILYSPMSKMSKKQIFILLFILLSFFYSPLLKVIFLISNQVFYYVFLFSMGIFKGYLTLIAFKITYESFSDETKVDQKKNSFITFVRLVTSPVFFRVNKYVIPSQFRDKPFVNTIFTWNLVNSLYNYGKIIFQLYLEFYNQNNIFQMIDTKISGTSLGFLNYNYPSLLWLILIIILGIYTSRIEATKDYITK